MLAWPEGGMGKSPDYAHTTKKIYSPESLVGTGWSTNTDIWKLGPVGMHYPYLSRRRNQYLQIGLVPAGGDFVRYVIDDNGGQCSASPQLVEMLALLGLAPQEINLIDTRNAQR